MGFKQSAKYLRCTQEISKLNFSVHFLRNCDYYPNLVCSKFDSDLGVASCRGCVSVSRRGA